MKKSLLYVFSCLLLTFSTYAQTENLPVITRSKLVQLEPQAAMGYMVLRNPGNVSSWQVQVFEPKSGSSSQDMGNIVMEYSSKPDLNYVSIASEYYAKNNYSFRIQGLDASGTVVVEEDHQVQGLTLQGSNWVENDCKKFTCVGPDYAYKIGIASHISNGSYILSLREAYKEASNGIEPSIPYYENCVQIRFDDQFPHRGVQLGYNEGIDYKHMYASPGDGVFTFQGNPIKGGYYLLKKDLGPWRGMAGSETVPLGSSDEICGYTFDFASELLSDHAPELYNDPLYCQNDLGQGPGGGGGVNPSNPTTAYAGGFLNCLISLPVFPGTTPPYPTVGGNPFIDIRPILGYLVDLYSFENSLDDCFNEPDGYSTAPNDGETTKFPGVRELSIIPLSVNTQHPVKTLVFEKGKRTKFTGLESLPEGIYVMGILLEDLTYVYLIGEVFPESHDPKTLKFSISPNPTAYSENFTITLESEIQGKAKVDIIDVATAVVVEEGKVSNDSPFITSITSNDGNPKTYRVVVYTDEQQGTKQLIVK